MLLQRWSWKGAFDMLPSFDVSYNRKCFDVTDNPKGRQRTGRNPVAVSRS